MGQRVKQNIIERLQVGEKIYHQQLEMYRRKVNRIENRIVSFHRPYVRSIKRGKEGKKVEFGGKGALVYVGEFLFLDHFDHRVFAEENLMVEYFLGYVERFGKLLFYVTADTKYRTQENRKFSDELKVSASNKGRGGRLKHSRPRIKLVQEETEAAQLDRRRYC